MEYFQFHYDNIIDTNPYVNNIHLIKIKENSDKALSKEYAFIHNRNIENIIIEKNLHFEEIYHKKCTNRLEEFSWEEKEYADNKNNIGTIRN